MFAWVTGFPQLMGRSGATVTQTDVVNLRTNTATNGVSVDVPTWAAGCMISMYMTAATAGTSTYFGWTVFAAPIGGTNPIFQAERNGRSIFGDATQVIVPFFDEPTFTVTWFTDGTGTGTYAAYLLGFVRNV